MLLLSACDDDEGPLDPFDPFDPDRRPICDGPPPADPACGRVEQVVQIWGMPHPGRGGEVVARLFDACDGGVLPAAYHECLEPSGGGATAPRQLAPGALLILAAAPAAGEDGAATVAAIEALIDARPPGEAIALHRWGPTIDQVVDFTRDRERIRVLAPSAFAAPIDGDRAPIAPAVAAAADLVEKLGGSAELSLRSVVVIGGTMLPAGEPRAALIEWIPADAGAARDASSRLDAIAGAGAAGVGVCGAAALSVAHGAGHQTSLALPPPLPEEDRLTCDAQAVARGDRPFARRLEFVFTPEQRAVYERRVARNSRLDFDLSIAFGDAETIPAVAHHRGHGSMQCERKAYSVNLEAMGPRPLVAGSMNDEFFLLSLCWDQAYVENYTYDQVLSEMDFFPMKFDYVELVIDGEHRGVYLLVEKPHEAMRLDHARPIGVVRRNHEIDGDPEDVKLFVDGAEWIMDEYDALLDTAQSTSGDEMIAALRERMAFDHYLRYVATMTALRNSDYGDEVRFLATERIEPPRALFEISAWDPEDMLRLDCVWEAYTLYDPTGLVYCAEGWLEQAVLDDPVAHRLYATKLEQVMAELTPERFEQALARTRERLLPFFEDPEVRAASIELSSPATLEEAAAKIDHRLRVMRQRFASWRRTLMDRLAAYP